MPGEEYQQEIKTVERKYTLDWLEKSSYTTIFKGSPNRIIYLVLI